jgi:pimeloyl-ACP methyl ester carboxylesterase
VGLSDSGPQPRTSGLIVGELHTLLTKKGIQGPYVLVGHSFGGLNVRLYANQYRNEVAGMVLVDASHEDQYEWYAAHMSPPDKERYLRHEGGHNLERVDILASAEEIRGAASLPNVPLIVLSAGQTEHDPVPQAIQDMQTKLAQLVTDGKQITVEETEHFVQLDRPFIVADAIFVVVRKARHSSTVAT